MPFDPGYGAEPFRSLCDGAPGTEVYPLPRFRLEWGPIFHRGRLDGTARVLVIGQDPAAHEAIARRILCGVAGHRVQGFLAKLGVDRSYVMINSFLYSLFGTQAPAPSAAQREDRFRWIDAVRSTSPIELVVTFGAVATTLWQGYLADRQPAGMPLAVPALHPTAHAPDAQLLANWNEALDLAHPAVAHPDHKRALHHYGSAWTDADLVDIPATDLPPGLPGWMAGALTWAVRGDDPLPAPKETRITVTIPEADRPQRPGNQHGTG